MLLHVEAELIGWDNADELVNELIVNLFKMAVNVYRGPILMRQFDSAINERLSHHLTERLLHLNTHAECYQRLLHNFIWKLIDYYLTPLGNLR